MPIFLWYLIALFSGVILSFSQSPTDFWFLIFPCFSLFFIAYTKADNKKQTFLIGFLFSMGYFVTGLNWIGNALLVEGNDYEWAWPLAVIALPALLSLFTALFLTISFIIFKNKSLIAFLGFCFALFVSEWVRGYAFTGFPWNLYGYTWIGLLDIAQLAYWIGPYGLTLLTIFWGSAFGVLYVHKSKALVLFLIFVLSIMTSYWIGTKRLNSPLDFKTSYDDVEIQIIQPNIPQTEKWLPEKMAENFEKHIALSKVLSTETVNIIIWPETALSPALIGHEAVREQIKSVLGRNSILLTGALEAESIKRKPYYFNSLMMFDNNAVPLRLYAKTHLVPFGEYIPFQNYIPLKPVVEFSGFQRGNGSETIKIADYPSFTPKICYEIIFPHQMIVRDQPRPDFILTVTNDAWYGDSPGPYQHFTQARFRAIENKIPVIRSANTGVSGIIDSFGRIIQKSNLMEQTVIKGTLPPSQIQ